MLQWREAVFHGTIDFCRCCQRRISRNKSSYFLFGVKHRRDGIVEAVQVYGTVNVKEYYIRIA